MGSAHGNTMARRSEIGIIDIPIVDAILDVLRVCDTVAKRETAISPVLVGKVAIPAQRETMEKSLAELKATGFCVVGVEDEIETISVAGRPTGNYDAARKLELALLMKLSVYFGCDAPATS